MIPLFCSLVLFQENITKQDELEETKRILSEIAQREFRKKIEDILELARLSSERKQYERTVILCKTILQVDPHNQVAKTLKNDSEKLIIEKIEMPSLLKLAVIDDRIIELEKETRISNSKKTLQHLERLYTVKKTVQNQIEMELKELFRQLDANDPVIRDYATEKIINAGKLYVELKSKVTDLLKEAKNTKNAEVEWRCAYILEEIEKIQSQYKTESIHGLICAVDQKSGIVVIGVGQENGAKAGDRFIVHRYGHFVAEVKVIVAYRDYCNTIVSITNTKEMLYPQKGDSIYKE